MTNKPIQILPERKTNRALMLIAIIFTIVTMSILHHNYSFKRDRLAMSTYNGEWIDE